MFFYIKLIVYWLRRVWLKVFLFSNFELDNDRKKKVKIWLYFWMNLIIRKFRYCYVKKLRYYVDI